MFRARARVRQAVVLYQKAGWQKRALELCFSARLFDALRKVAEDLSADSDPEILAKCAQFFMEHQQHDKARSAIPVRLGVSSTVSFTSNSLNGRIVGPNFESWSPRFLVWTWSVEKAPLHVLVGRYLSGLQGGRCLRVRDVVINMCVACMYVCMNE